MFQPAGRVGVSFGCSVVIETSVSSRLCHTLAAQLSFLFSSARVSFEFGFWWLQHCISRLVCHAPATRWSSVVGDQSCRGGFLCVCMCVCASVCVPALQKVTDGAKSREQLLDAREKQKADRFCM